VSESFGDNGEGYVGGEHQGRLAMAQIMQPNCAQACRLGELTEPFGEMIRGDRAPVLTGEHQVMIEVDISPPDPIVVLLDPVG